MSTQALPTVQPKPCPSTKHHSWRETQTNPWMWPSKLHPLVQNLAHLLCPWQPGSPAAPPSWAGQGWVHSRPGRQQPSLLAQPPALPSGPAPHHFRPGQGGGVSRERQASGHPILPSPSLVPCFPPRVGWNPDIRVLRPQPALVNQAILHSQSMENSGVWASNCPLL